MPIPTDVMRTCFSLSEIAMPELKSSLPYDPNRLLDMLAAWFGVTNDRMLARMLRLSLSMVRSMRTGALPVRPSILSVMAEAAGKSTDELRYVLGERRRKVRMSCSVRAA